MTHVEAYNKGWSDYRNNVRYSEPPADVLDPDSLLSQWQRGWIDHLERD